MKPDFHKLIEEHHLIRREFRQRGKRRTYAVQRSNEDGSICYVACSVTKYDPRLWKPVFTVYLVHAVVHYDDTDNDWELV